jgi:hypothetical protein
MARSKITSSSKDLINDNGAVLISVIQGEQIHLELTLSWLTNLQGYAVQAKVQEGKNDGLGNKPTLVQPSGVVTTLPLLNPLITDNIITLVIPQTLGATWSVQPTPDKPVYGFIELEVSDTGLGNQQQIWKPFRGLVEVRYSPTEAS